MNSKENQASSRSRRGTRFGLLPVLALALLLLSPPALADEVNLPKIGLSLSLPDSLDVFTRGMSPDNPLLRLKGQSAGQVRVDLAARGLSLLAQDISGAYEIQLSAAPDPGTDFSGLDEPRLGEIAGQSGAGQYEILSTRQAAFLLMTNGGEASCLTRVRDRLFTLRLISSSRPSEAMVNTLRGIAGSMDFGLRQ